MTEEEAYLYLHFEHGFTGREVQRAHAAREASGVVIIASRAAPSKRGREATLRPMIKRMTTVVFTVASLMGAAPLVAQTATQAHHAPFPCLDDGLKANDFGCLLLGKREFASFPEGPLFWNLTAFATRAAAEAAASTSSIVVEADGKFWLSDFGPKSAASGAGEAVASIGPLALAGPNVPVFPSYQVVVYLAVMPPGRRTGVHTHPGPEAWYMLAGEQCLETPNGIIRARTGEGAMVGPGLPMQLTNNGPSTRRALFIVIHDAAQAWGAPTANWTPSGACDAR